MTISRPRPSILSLFDPLTGTTDPSTPPRNSDSPSLDSDKENNGPPRNDLTLTTFFNRTYKPKHNSPKRLTRRLVDVGDVTADNIDPLWPADDEAETDISLALDGFEDDENDTLTFRQIAAAATPKWNTRTPKASTSVFRTPSHPRTPLAELPLDHDETPVFRGNTSKRLTLATPSRPTQANPVQIVVTEPDTMEDVDLFPSTEHNPRNSALDTDQNKQSPGPLACSASSLNLSSLSTNVESLMTERNNLAISASSYVSSASPSASLDIPRLRSVPPKTSCNDRSRHSVDLQSSFQMHLDSEATFDLLNDKISFLDSVKNEMETSVHDFAEGGFDLSFEEANLAAFATAIKKPQPVEAVCDVPFSDHEPELAPRLYTADQAEVAPDNTHNSPHAPSPVSKAPPRDEGSASLTSGRVVNAESSLNINAAANGSVKIVRAERHREENTFSGVTTPKHARLVPAAPPPVAGLKIVKRSKLALQKARASGDADVPSEPNNLKSPPFVHDRRSSFSPPTTVQTTTSSSNQTRVTGPASRVDIIRANVPPLTRRPIASEGARRVLLEGQGPKPSAITSRPNPGRLPPSGGNVTGPRRVPVSSATICPRSAGSGTLKPVSASTSSVPKPLKSTSRAISSIPQPTARAGASRLPAPSAVVRPTGAVGMEGNRGIQIRRVI